MSIIHVPFYPSDWLAGTRGMSDAETGVYITLIAKMYEMAGPIERDDDRLYRTCGCKSKPAFVKVLNYLIGEGKILQSDEGLFNEKVQKVIKATTDKSEKAKAAAQSRWDRKASKNNNPDDADASLGHMPDECQSKPKSKPYKEEDTKVSLQVSPANEATEAVQIFNAASDRRGWPSVQKMTPNRTKAIKARLGEVGGVDGWRVAIEKAEASNFLCGRTNKPWTAFGFDWLVKSQNFTKLMEGNYDNRDTQSGTSERGSTGGVGRGTADAFAAVAREREQRAGRGGDAY